MAVKENPDIVIIPEGFFFMGSESGHENEMPRHRVWVDNFGIGRFPVTNREYKIFVEEGEAPAPLSGPMQCFPLRSNRWWVSAGTKRPRIVSG